jgi:hypothetical protein
LFPKKVTGKFTATPPPSEYRRTCIFFTERRKSKRERTEGAIVAVLAEEGRRAGLKKDDGKTVTLPQQHSLYAARILV